MDILLPVRRQRVSGFSIASRSCSSLCGEAASASASASDGDGDRKMIYGAEALQTMFKKLEETKTIEQLALSDLALYGTFRHLLKLEQCKTLDKWVSVLYSKQPVAKAKPASKKKAKPSPSQDQGTAVGLSLLGL